MQVTIQINRGVGFEVVENVKALTYTFPKKGTQPMGYNLIVNGEAVGFPGVATTGREGGKYPCYTYFKHEGVSYWLPAQIGLLPAGSRIDVIATQKAEAPKVETAPVEEAPKAEEAPKVEEAATTKKSRRKPVTA